MSGVMTTSSSETIAAPPFYVYYAFVVPPVASVGVFFNVFALAVFCTRHLRSSGTAYFMALAMSDVLFLACAVVAYSCQPLQYYMDPTVPYDELSEDRASWASDALIKIFPVLEISQVLVSFYILAASVDHYVFMFKTRRGGDESAGDTSQKLIVLIFGLVTLAHLPQIFKMQIETISVAGSSWVKLCTSTLYLTDFVQFYERYGHVICLVLLPTVGHMVTNIAIQVRYWYNNRGPEGSEERQGAVMRDGRSRPAMLALASTRFILVFPYIVIRFLTGAHTPFDYAVLRCVSDTRLVHYASPDDNLELVAFVCLMADCVLRFMVYAIFHKEFINHLSKLCKRKKRNLDSPPFKPRRRSKCLCCREPEVVEEPVVYSIHPSTRMAVPVAAPPYRERAYAPRSTLTYSDPGQPMPLHQFALHNDIQARRAREMSPRPPRSSDYASSREDDFPFESRSQLNDLRRDPEKIDNRARPAAYTNRNDLNNRWPNYKADNQAYVPDQSDDSRSRHASDRDYNENRRNYRRDRRDQSYM